jgi:hypothetical protein
VNSEEKLDRWAERELARNINNIIIQDAEGKVFAFGRYVIVSENRCARVIKNSNDVAVFTNRATAMSWCVADQHNNINLARRVMALDLNRRMLHQDIELRRAAAERSRNQDFRERVLTKINAKQDQLNQVRAELLDLMSQAKYTQLQGLQNETSRTRRA